MYKGLNYILPGIYEFGESTLRFRKMTNLAYFVGNKNKKSQDWFTKHRKGHLVPTSRQISDSADVVTVIAEDLDKESIMDGEVFNSLYKDAREVHQPNKVDANGFEQSLHWSISKPSTYQC